MHFPVLSRLYCKASSSAWESLIQPWSHQELISELGQSCGMPLGDNQSNDSIHL